MTERKDKSGAAASRDRGEGLRLHSGQIPVGGKVAEMATLTAAASGLAFGAIDMARADGDVFENNVFARILRDEPDEPMPSDAAREDDADMPASMVAVAEPEMNPPPVLPVSTSSPGMLADVVVSANAAIPEAADAPHVADAKMTLNSRDSEAHFGASDAPMPGPAIVTEKLTEGIASQISSGIDRIFDGIASGTIQPDFAQEIAGEIVSNVRSMLDEAVPPPPTDLASSISADVKDTLAGVGDGAKALLSSPADMLDQLTGRLNDALADSGLVPSIASTPDGIDPATSGLASLPASILGGIDGKPGALGELFYDDGQSVPQVEHPADAVLDSAATTVFETFDAIPLDLGFIGQSDLGDIQPVSGFLGNSNPLHLV